MEVSELLKSRRGSELLGIVILAAGVILAISLVTYNPTDSSAFFTSSTTDIGNGIGYYGATLAWILVGFFGFSSLLLPTALLLLGWNRFWGKEVEHFHTKLLGFIVLMLAIPPIFDLAFGEVWLRGALVRAGGYLGHEIGGAVSASLNVVGASIALTTAILIGLLLATRISLASIFVFCKERLVAASRALYVRWARFTERRRKDQMKAKLLSTKLSEARVAEAPPARTGEPASLASDGSNVVSFADRGPSVRQVPGPGGFRIRKVTKADLRKAAEDLVVQGVKAPEERVEQQIFTSAFFSLEVDAMPARRFPSRPAAAPPTPIEDDADGFDEADELDTEERALPKLPRPKPRPPAKQVVREEAKKNLSSERLPFVNLLKPGPERGEINDDSHRRFLEVGRHIEEKSREFNVEGEVTAYHPGPVVTTFEFKPSAGVKYARVVNLGDDLALALKAESIRIERISGSSTVGIEVPNAKRDIIALREIIDSDVFSNSSSLLTLALGKDIHGDPVVTDLARMPHLLVAGATGAGKSVGLNSMIVSLLYKALPKQLRMLMIDPKMVELKVYEDIPHLLHPIVTDPKLASHALTWAVQEMEARYKKLAECGVRNIEQYNVLVRDPEALRRGRRLGADQELGDTEQMHYIVIVIDEFADLMMVAPKDVEESVTRLAQKARAVGVHLIIATQRPSVDVITGVIKANFPSRISFQVASRIDSRTILDAQGAEKLLGMGDSLFLPPGTARVRRIHGAYVSEKEIVDIVDFVKKHQGRPEYIDEITTFAEEKENQDTFEFMTDPKYDEAVRTVLTTGQASASYLQRRMKLGYSRAARLIEMMEANGILGPSQGSKPREILIRADDYPGMMDASNL
ncbi:MAG: DNA translocase FtsK [Thermoanaerobaculia bacterium]|nr:DNA translocase FtsK [Thermoanaerobaculia bacterium]